MFVIDQYHIKALLDECHIRSKASGWWTDPITGLSLIPGTNDLLPEQATEEMRRAWFPYVIGTKIALIHSEISEGLEAYRVGAYDDKLPHYEGLVVEMADAMIRIGDLLGVLDLSGDAAKAWVEKFNFNVSRPDHTLEARRKPGGKKF